MFLDDAPEAPETGNLFPGLPRLPGRCPFCKSTRINSACFNCQGRKARFQIPPLTDQERAATAELERRAAERESAEAAARLERFGRLEALGRRVRVAFVSCGKAKAAGPAPACDFYRGASVRLSLAYARRVVQADETYILSALYGLVTLDQVLEPYERTLMGLRQKERADWANNVTAAAAPRFRGLAVDAYFLAGADYSFPGLPGWAWRHPLEGKTQGRRLQFLSAELRRVGAHV